MNIKLWTSNKKTYKLYIIKMKGDDKYMEAFTIKKPNAFKGISLPRKDTRNKDNSFEKMRKCGEEIKSLFNLNEEDIYNLLKR
ncbi:hypothetical protein [Clostridium lacusfryxellense]|uniref:hypothetical protein n=1 Tax=Clostridium lacusfryxellense TaxID=205328 RepID=UPI001C0E7B3B|nr:hypothetical protein [Clostridium lacusfryxellense]MBU3112133.1 hypothetical protein [Clostridium lacusfryxellense]